MLKEYGLFEKGIKNHLMNETGNLDVHFLSGLKQVIMGDVIYNEYIDLSTGILYIGEIGENADMTLEIEEVTCLENYQYHLMFTEPPKAHQFTYVKFVDEFDGDKGVNSLIFNADVYEMDGTLFVAGSSYEDIATEKVTHISELNARIVKGVKDSGRFGKEEPRMVFKNPDHYMYIDDENISHIFIDEINGSMDTIDYDIEAAYQKVTVYSTDVFFQVKSGILYKCRIVYFNDHSDKFGNNYITTQLHFEIMKDKFTHRIDNFTKWMLDVNKNNVEVTDVWQYLKLTDSLQIRNFMYHIYSAMMFDFIEMGYAFVTDINIRFKKHDDETVVIEFISAVENL